MSEDEIKKLILSSSCDLDPFSTSMVKSCLDIIITPITNISNISMEPSSIFSQNFKDGHTRPLLGRTEELLGRTEEFEVCMQIEFKFQNLTQGGSQSTTSSYKKTPST